MALTRSTLLLTTTSLALLLLTAGSCTEPEPEVDDCRAELVGEWESVEEFPCPAVDPNCTYRHTLSFDGSNYDWYPSGDSDSGAYTCEAGMVEALGIDGMPAFTAVYDATADTLELSWTGQTTPVPYQRTP